MCKSVIRSQFNDNSIHPAEQLSRTRISNSISSGLKSPVFEPCVMLLAPDVVVRGRWLAPFMGMVEHVDLVSGGKIILAFFNKNIGPNHLIYLSGVSRKFAWHQVLEPLHGLDAHWFKTPFSVQNEEKSKMLWDHFFWVNNMLQPREQSDQKEFVA